MRLTDIQQIFPLTNLNDAFAYQKHRDAGNPSQKETWSTMSRVLEGNTSQIPATDPNGRDGHRSQMDEPTLQVGNTTDNRPILIKNWTYWKCLPRLLWRAEIECIKTFTLARALDNHPPRSVLLRQRQFGSNLTSKTILSALTLMPATERNNNDLATWFGYRFSKPAGQRRARHVERDLFCRSSKMQHMTVVVVLFQKLQNMLYQKGTSSSSRPLLLETNGIACIRTILFIIIKWDAEHR